MSWISTNLAGIIGGNLEKADAAIADAQKSLTNLNSQVGALAGNLNAAVSALTINKSMLDKLAESGFYMITLSPKKGAWDARLAAAMNEPPNQGFCAGTATIILSADLATVESAYAKTKAAFMKPLDDAKAFIDATDFSDFEIELPDFEDVPEFQAPDWDALFAMDQWNSATLGDVFGGAMEGIASSSARIGKAAKAIISQKNQVNRMASALNGGLNRASGFVADLAATGAYSVLLEPSAGGYLTRLQSETGAPPSDGDMYSAGFVCVATAAGAAALNTKFATISTLMGG